MEEKEEIKDFYKKRCEVPDEMDTKFVTSCNRKPTDVPQFVKQALGLIHEDIVSRSYGCSTTYPEALEGAKVLDLGSGSGRDCFVLSNLVGQDGFVVGLDMTDNLRDLASSKIEYHQKKYGYSSPNVSFIKGYMEKLEEAGLEENYFDIIVSNCVISLCQDKTAVLKAAARVLKPYGEMYFSDMYRKGDPPLDAMNDKFLWCEGLTGSMTIEQFHSMAGEVGFAAPQLVKASELPILDKSVKDRIGDVRYAAVTYRLFKKSPTPTSPSTLVYKGGIRGSEDAFQFNHRLPFKKNVGVSLDEETTTIITESRFGKYFEGGAEPGIVVDQNKHMSSEVVDPFSLI